MSELLYSTDILNEWQAASKQIAAVLAVPLLLEYKPELLDRVITVVLLGLTAACIAVPIAVPAVAGVAVACWTLRGASGGWRCMQQNLRC